MSTRRSEFVLATTISELILLLFFLLLLLFGYYYMESEKAEKELKYQIKAVGDQKAQLQAVLDGLFALTGREPTQEEMKTLVSLDQAQALLAESVRKASEAEAKAAALQSLLKKLREDGAFITKTSPQELERFSDMALCQTQAEDLSLRTKELGDANRRNRQLTDRLTKCTGGKGQQFVACWATAQNKVEFVFDTRITSDGILVTRKWPESRDQEMERFAGARALVGRTVSTREFLDATAELFADSEGKACRYFVIISGKRSEMSAQMFTTYQRIQDHFYHLNQVN